MSTAVLERPIQGAAPIRVMGLAEAKCFGYPDLEPPALKTEDDLNKWAAELPGYDTTFYYAGFVEWGFAVRVPDNPEAIAQGNDALISFFQSMVEAYRSGSGGKLIFWRTRPEVDSWKGEIVEYREDGPERCMVTDRPCVRDYSHVLIKIYARFCADDAPVGETMYISAHQEPPPGWNVVEHIPKDQAKRCVKAGATQ